MHTMSWLEMWRRGWRVAACVLLLGALAPAQAVPGVDVVPALLQTLQAAGPEVRARAAKTLADLRDPRALAPLVVLLRQAANSPALAAITVDGMRYADIVRGAVSRFGTAAVGPLTVAVQAEPLYAKQKLFLDALAETRVPEAIPPLTNAMRAVTDPAARAEVGMRIAGFGERGVTALAKLLRDDAPELRAAAQRTLIAAGKKAIPAMVALLRDQASNLQARVSAQAVLQHLGPVATEAIIPFLTDAQPELRQWAVAALGQWQDPRAFAPLLAQANDNNAMVRAAVLAALAALRDPDAVGDAPGRVLPVLINALGDADGPVRQVAQQALGRWRDPRAADALLAALKVAPATEQVLIAAALGQQNDPRAVAPLLELAMAQDKPLRIAALGALAALGEPTAVEPLLGVLRDEDPQVRLQAIRALAVNPDQRAVDPLMQLLGDANPLIRTAVAQALKGQRHARVAAALIVAWQKEPLESRETREALAAALGDSGDPPAFSALVDDKRPEGFLTAVSHLSNAFDSPRITEFLLNCLKEKNPAIRAAAASRLGERNDPRILPALTAALKDKYELNTGSLGAPVREAAATALGAVGNPAAVSALITALADRSPSVAHAAMVALSTITDQHFGYDIAAWKKWAAKLGAGG